MEKYRLRHLKKLLFGARLAANFLSESSTSSYISFPIVRGDAITIIPFSISYFPEEYNLRSAPFLPVTRHQTVDIIPVSV